MMNNRTKYFLDTEFIEHPCSIDLISIGIVCEDGRELYRISAEFDESKASEWVKANVISRLGEQKRSTREQIKRDVLEFVGDHARPEFWGYYSDYDWVVFCWLFGSMMDLPKGWPMYCRDLKQWADELGNPKLPEQGKGEHNALDDAKWNQRAWAFLLELQLQPRAEGGAGEA